MTDNCRDCCCTELADRYKSLEAKATKRKRRIRRLKSKNLKIAILYNQAIDLLDRRQKVIEEVIKNLESSTDSD